MNPNVSIIILNWNGWKDTIECLESLYQINYENFNVVVVDNCSKDDSIQKIKEYCQGDVTVESKFFTYNPSNKPIKIFEYDYEQLKSLGEVKNNLNSLPSNLKLILIKNNKNYGFAEGNNIAIQHALKTLKSNYVLLLNNDTVVDKDFLVEMINVAEANEKIGIVGSKTYFYEKEHLIQLEGIKLNWFLGEINQINHKKEEHTEFDNKIRYSDAICGCSMLIKEEVISKIGFLDPRYFLYFEDIDFSIRTKRSGYDIIYVPNSKIWHKMSVSTKKGSIKEYYWGRNLFRFMKCYSNKKQYYCFLLYFFLFKFWFINIVNIFYRNNLNAVYCFFKGVINGLKKVE